MNLERTMIGELMQINLDDRIDAIIELDKDGIFLEHSYKQIFDTIVELSLKKIEPDPINIFQNNQSISSKEIQAIYSEVISPAYYKDHIFGLKSRKYKNEILKIISANFATLNNGVHGEDIDEIKNGLIADLSGIEFQNKSEFIDFDLLDEKLFKHIKSGNKIEGYSWGVSDLDRWTSGIVVPRVHIIGGLKKAGKSRFLIHTIKSLYLQQVPTAFLSLEMPAYEVNKLLKSALTGIDDIKLRSGGFISSQELEDIKQTKINKSIGVEVKSGLDLGQVISRIRRYAKLGFKVVCIDYIQRIKHETKNEAQELEKISTTLADAAREYNVALIILAQLNAMAEREPPNLGHLKGSSGIGEAADTILLIDNVYRRTKERKNEIDLYCEQRYGDSGKLTMFADLGSCSFRDLATKNQLDDFKNQTTTKENIF